MASATNLLERSLQAKLARQVRGLVKGSELAEIPAVMRHPIITKLDKCEFAASEVKSFCALRFTAVISTFEAMLERAIFLARQTGKAALAEELQHNLDDELGQGRAAGLGAHKEWRVDFLSALVIEPVRNAAAPQLYSFTENDTLAELCGVILAAEYSIPKEYGAVVRSLKKTHPDKIVSGLEEGTDEQKKNGLYLHHHIWHDAKDHFPHLLKAIVQDVGLEAEDAITKGIERFARERNGFYDFISQNLGHCAGGGAQDRILKSLFTDGWSR